MVWPHLPEKEEGMQSSCIGVALEDLAARAIPFPNEVGIKIIYVLILWAYKLYRLGLWSLRVCECGKLVLP